MKDRKLRPETDPKKWEGASYRPTIDLGELADGSHTTLPPYVEIDHVQIHPSRFRRWVLRQEVIKNERKGHKRNSD